MRLGKCLDEEGMLGAFSSKVVIIWYLNYNIFMVLLMWCGFYADILRSERGKIVCVRKK